MLENLMINPVLLETRGFWEIVRDLGMRQDGSVSDVV